MSKRDVSLPSGSKRKRNWEADPKDLHPSVGTHDVFISHRGPQMKRGFASHLYCRLQDRGIKAFFDEEEFPKGQDVRPFMLEAAGRAGIGVPIFTDIYAQSSWCLDELVEMMNSKAKVFPVFFKVDPQDLTMEHGPFAKAIKAHREKGEHDEMTIKRWEGALHEASYLEGFRLREDGFEGKLLQKLVTKIVEEMPDAQAVVEGDERSTVGLKTRVDDVLERLHLNDKSSVYFVLLWGMGGIGKTTLAKATFNALKGKQFREAASFVEDCRDKKPSQIKSELCKQLLLDENIKDLTRSLEGKEVFIVLDDVSEWKSIEEVTKSLPPGSRVLVTSRDQRVLPPRDFFKAELYEVQGMNLHDSLRLFCLHAFQMPSPDQGFEDLATKVCEACRGLPLSLEVLGSHLRGREKKEFWQEAINLLHSNEHKGITTALMISYNALSEDEQGMFLDVACFLIGQHKQAAECFWDGLVAAPITGLYRLVELCLVKVHEEEDDFYRWTTLTLTMHDHLRDLGRDIVKKEWEKTGKLSRLWDDADLLSRASQSEEGLHQIRGIVTSGPNFNACLLSKMRSLGFLCLKQTRVDGDVEGLKGLQIKSLIYHNDTQICKSDWEQDSQNELSFSCRQFLWQGLDESLEYLDVCILAITKLPSSLGRLKKLRTLHLGWCHKLEELPEDMGSLESLEALDAQESAITKLPSSLGRLKKLRTLNLGGCVKLEELPEDIGSLECLEVLDVGWSAITKLPSSLGRLKKLRRLFLAWCKKLEELPEDMGSLESLEVLDAEELAITKLPSSLGRLKTLRMLQLGGCKKLEELPEDIGSLESLEELDVRISAITKLPSSLGRLKKLRMLDLRACKKLEELPKDMGSLESLKVLDVGWSAITKLPSSLGRLKKLQKLLLEECEKLEELPEDIGSLESLKELDVEGSTITKLPSSLGQLKKLQTLQLRCENLEELPEDMGLLESLEALTVWESAITKLPSSLGRLKKLRTLCLQWCKKLEELPEDMGSLESLEELNVKWSAITKLPSSLVRLKTLRTLDLGGCRKLEELPEDIGSLESLEALNVWESAITKLPSSLGRLKKLRTLQLGGCHKLEELPEDVGLLESLEELDVCVSAITKLPSSLGRLKKLGWVREAGGTVRRHMVA